MESLYRKYRPLTFESVVGQQHIVSTLEHAVTEGRLSHAYLFCGPRGTGKTTMARILAKSLLCQGADAARAQGAAGCLPDGSCPECAAIAEGTHPDVYELDAASRTGVDNVREEIIGSVNFAPVRGAYKIYIIDEVHMLTTAAFNALLKTLEEPPAHVVFVLCTTDPQKIPETILSRCQRFDFHRIGNEDIVGRLRFICEQEGFAFDDDALEVVAKHARGGMRDALSTLEQLSVFGNGSVRAADARALLGEVSGTVLSRFSHALASRDVSTLFALVKEQVDAGEDLMELTRDLVAHVRDVYMAHVAGARPELIEGTPEEIAALAEEAALFESGDRLSRVLVVLDDAALEMRSAADMRLVLEIALTRLARPEADLTLEALAERLERLEAQIAKGIPSAPLAAADVAALVGAKMPKERAAGFAEPRSASVPAASPVEPVASAAPKAASSARAADAASGASANARFAVSESDRASARVASVEPAVPADRVEAAVPAAPMPAAEKTVEAASAVVEPQTPSPISTASQAAATQAEPVRSSTVPAAAAPTAAPAAAPAAPTAAPAAAPAAPAAEPSAAAAVCDPGELQRKWDEVVRLVTAAQPSRGSLLLSSRAVADDGEALTVSFPAGSNFAITMLGRPDTQSIVQPQVAAVFGVRMLNYVMAEVQPAARSMSTSAAPASQPAPATSAIPASQPAPAAFAASGTPAPVASEVPAATASSAPEPAAPVAAAPEHAPATAIGFVQTAPVDDQVPYDDATAFDYAEDDLPPFDMPANASSAQTSSMGSAAPVDLASEPVAAVQASIPPANPAPAAMPSPAQAPSSAPAPSVTPAPDSLIEKQSAPASDAPAAAPASSGSGATDDIKDILGNIFGDGVVFTKLDS
ncbi:DNA polymerase III subunit gamma/tau [uncultured Enorma sp.]|uniref:DNA polymerase III subunit gamma/tau n=1 Tax=uncultured Enorma sp. TaxID=1714346 RepID=UPI00260AB642|nr:DNA polymerase III subunit gamma/tau [uncultured Enorma sp.]